MTRCLKTFAALALGVCVAASVFAAGEKALRPKPPGLGDPGQLTSIAIETGRAADGKLTLIGNEASQQLVVTGTYSSSQVRDLSGTVVYKAEPANVVAVSATGLVTPLGDGTATVTATAT